MSKKIIYLLSLLMALKNGITNATDGLTPDKVPSIDNTDKAGEDGLFSNYGDLVHTEPIAKKEVTKGNGTDYVRNPVIVNLGKGNLVVFAELRYKRIKDLVLLTM